MQNFLCQSEIVFLEILNKNTFILMKKKKGYSGKTKFRHVLLPWKRAYYTENKIKRLEFKVHKLGAKSKWNSAFCLESGERRRRSEPWGRGRGRVLMPMGGRRSAFEFQCLAPTQHYVDTDVPTHITLSLVHFKVHLEPMRTPFPRYDV